MGHGCWLFSLQVQVSRKPDAVWLHGSNTSFLLSIIFISIFPIDHLGGLF